MIETKKISLDVLLLLRKQMKESLFLLEEELLKSLTLWQSKADYGFHVQAIMQYRQENKCTIAQAKEAVDSFLSNK